MIRLTPRSPRSFDLASGSIVDFEQWLAYRGYTRLRVRNPATEHSRWAAGQRCQLVIYRSGSGAGAIVVEGANPEFILLDLALLVDIEAEPRSEQLGLFDVLEVA